MSTTAKLLAFAHAEHHLPAAVAADCERLLADTLAVGAAGATAPAARIQLAALRDSGALRPGGACRLIGAAERADAASAAWFNGFAIHCLEWDAVHEPAVVHALSTVTAALLAECDRRGDVESDEFLTALAVGVDIACGFGLAAPGAMRFFRPATAGLMGAALAAARLRRLPKERFADVLGLAYSQVAGTMQAHVEGSSALPFQIANAARAAITAVDCAAAGLDGPHDSLDGPFGYWSLIEAGDLAPYCGTLGNLWQISGISTKPFPSGRASHAVLGTLQRLMHEGHVTPASFERLEAHVPPLIMRLVGRPVVPEMTAGYARLTLRILVALMLRDGHIDPRTFTPEALADPALHAVAARVDILPDGSDDPNALVPQRVVVHAGGKRFDVAVPATLGSPEAPFTPRDAAAKYDLARALAAPACDERLFTSPLSYVLDQDHR